MAKQTFSVGQVLTAAQMTSLQATAMGGGAASSKTANYVLVAADAGTTISMTSTSATTITVNTGLFSAGDTVFIQNLGSATTTITAGTATVNTAGSLILPQYDAGILYFVSASSAIFYDYIQVGATSPLTTKGDLYTFASSDTRIGVGANNTVLTADSAEATGLKWATPASGGGMTLLATHTLSGSTSTISGISGSYTDLVLICTNGVNSANAGAKIYLNGNTTSTDYYTAQINFISPSLDGGYSNNPDAMQVSTGSSYNDSTYFYIHIPRYAQTENKLVMLRNLSRGSRIFFSNLLFASTAAITSVGFNVSSGSWSSGTVYVYGVK